MKYQETHGGRWETLQKQRKRRERCRTDLCLPFPSPDFLPSFVKKGFIAFSQIHDLKPETISETGVHSLTLAQIPDGS